jgi:4,5-DOPA dioxygenase extradiol
MLAKDIQNLVQKTQIELDHQWGLDHGTWSVLKHIYPEADVPVLQMSIDFTQSPASLYNLGKELQELRKKGVLFIGSGNIVHNLRRVAWNKLNEDNFGFDWAFEANNQFKNLILSNNHKQLLDFTNLGTAANLAIPTPEHFLPLLYILGMKQKNDEISIFNDKAVGGSLTMTSFKFY